MALRNRRCKRFFCSICRLEYLEPSGRCVTPEHRSWPGLAAIQASVRDEHLALYPAAWSREDGSAFTYKGAGTEPPGRAGHWIARAALHSAQLPRWPIELSSSASCRGY